MSPSRSLVGFLAPAVCGALLGACSPNSGDTVVRDVPRDVHDAASPCGDGGVCSDTTLTCCPGGCVNTRTDDVNCGACGNECALDEICQASFCYAPNCFPECSSREICCGTDCVDPLSNNDNCGDCGNACDAPLHCLGGSCVCGAATTGRRCNPDEDCCPSGCADLLSDPENCGACGNSCGGLPCNAGQCTCGSSVCPVGWTCCDGDTCADLTSDTSHCGACGTECDSKRSTGCVAGECVCGSEPQCAGGTGYPFCTVGPGLPVQRCCSGHCVQINQYSCTGCNIPCPGGGDCCGSAGIFDCTYSCSVGGC